MSYVEFAVTSNFSFLHGASHPEELVAQAIELGLAGLGLCDRNSVAGVVRAHVAKRESSSKLRYHPGARLVFVDGTPDILAYPRDRRGWGRLCRLLSLGNRRAKKGECVIYLQDLSAFADGLELVVMTSSTYQRCNGEAQRTLASTPSSGSRLKSTPTTASSLPSLFKRLREAAPGRVRLAAAMLYRGDDRRRLAGLKTMAQHCRVPLIAINDVLYHIPERRALQDVLTAIREHVCLDAAGRLLAVNAERHLKGADEMRRLFCTAPEAIAETRELSAALGFALDELSYQYPEETREGFPTPQEALVQFTWAGAAQRYPAGVPETVQRSLVHELELIAALNYAPYFLTVYDIVRFARSRDILCQGRGSAANSAVCFCLGITEVDPERSDLLFERFVSAERREPPDIDVDFEHERREEVIQHIYNRYGRERAGIAATVISYRARSAVREVGKAFGLSEDTVGAIASQIWGSGGHGQPSADWSRTGLNPRSPRVKKLLTTIGEIQGFPRHLSQHVGGFVITRDRLDEVVPIANAAMEGRTVVEWDKDDLDALGILKIDVLGLGMLSCLRKALTLLARHYQKRLTLSSIPPEDPAVYRMLQRADSIGVFQVESRAQMSMLPRLKPQQFYDLVVEVAIVRPGPIQGDMVHPYLRRRQGFEEVSYPSAELEAVLKKTLGVPLFQEQAMRIAIVAAGFTPTEADKLRRAMATFRRAGTIGMFKRKMVEGMVAKNYDRGFAERCFQQIEGFGEYGFPESHAASFALLVYASAWLKCRYPDVFAAALLNAQPMGFYAPAQIVRDVREHGVEVRAVDINYSQIEATLEPGVAAALRLKPTHREMAQDIRATHAIRLGLKEIKGLAEEDAKRIVAMRAGGYDSLRDLWLRTGLSPRVLERLADADAFGSLGLTRRNALWAAKALGRAGDQDDLPLLKTAGCPSPSQASQALGGDRRFREPEVVLPPMPLGEEVVNDYRFIKLSLRAHPASFLRAELKARGVLDNDALRQCASGAFVRVSGLITVRQRPGSANGVIFMSIEDETATANVIVWPKRFERFRPIVLGARYVMVSGRMQQECGVIHVIADRLEDLTSLLLRLFEPNQSLAAPGLSRATACDLAADAAACRTHAIDAMRKVAADLDVPARASAHIIAKSRNPSPSSDLAG